MRTPAKRGFFIAKKFTVLTSKSVHGRNQHLRKTKSSKKVKNLIPRGLNHFLWKYF